MGTFRARVVTPVDPDTVRFLEDAVVVVESGRLVEVGPYDGRPVDEDLRAGVLTPGFVDAHVHFPQTRIVGAASGPLLEWLAQRTFPEEARFADLDHARTVAATFTRALASSGTTLAMVYGSVHPAACDVLFEALDAAGLRAIAGPVLMDEHAPRELLLPVEPAIEGLSALHERWHGHDDRLQLAVVPRFALSCSRRMLTAAGAFARRHDLWATTHLSESPAECRIACERFRSPDYLRVYEDAGLLHARSVMAHCIHLSGAEWDRFAAAGAVVAHCPDSNFFLGSGNMPVHEVLARRIPLAIGTDVAAGRSFRVPRILSSAYDNGLWVEVSLALAQLLWWGTRGGALALGHPQVGAVQVGLDADLVLHEVPDHAEDLEAILAAIVFDHDAPRPLRTWVRGREVWRRERC